MDNRIEQFNNFFSLLSDVKLISLFERNENSFDGKIEIDTEKGKLLFDVEIPLSFPFSIRNFCIRFRCEKLIGYPHTNPDKSICIHTIATSNINKKLEFEYNDLKSWIQDFYIEEKKDSRYHYLLINNFSKNNFTILFQNTSYKLQEQGICKISFFENKVVFLKEVDNYSYVWGNVIKLTSFHLEVPYIFLEREPAIKNTNIRINTWQQLVNELTYRQTLYLYNIIGETRKTKSPPKILPVFIVYSIGNNEFHWDCIEVQVDTNVLDVKYQRQSGAYNFKGKDLQLQWYKTENVSYKRFFGRGKLSNKLIDKKILILGIGAIGSQVAKILTRGGVKNIDLVDYDLIEAGNICRSEYKLNDISIPKIHALSCELALISPHVNVELKIEVPKSPSGTETFEKNKKELEKYDYIFDCTADNEMLHLLEKMSLSHKTIHFSITNNAKELICTAGEKVSEYKHLIVEDIEQDPASFYEGTGCQYPTFEASYVDIQSLLSYALTNINFIIDKQKSLSSFLIRPKNSQTDFSIMKIQFNKYVQEELGLYINMSDIL